jgi:hypothetical protein
MQRIELVAEIAWMGETKKFGGLRFRELTADDRNQIRQWLTQTSESEIPDRKPAVTSSALREEADPCSNAQNETPDLLLPTPVLHHVTPTRADSTTGSISRFSSVPATALLPGLFSQEKQISISRQRPLRDLATGFLIFVFVCMPFLFLKDFRREIGNSLIRIGEKLKANRDTPPDTSSPTPDQSSNPTSVGAPSVPNPIPETSAKETLDQSGAVASTQTTQGTVNSTDSRLADRQYGRRHFADAHSSGGRSALARQLWFAVGAGDSSAEVALAQLYLTGDGVPRNCEQARVLLRAASKNGSIEALHQLQKLTKSGCR